MIDNNNNNNNSNENGYNIHNPFLQMGSGNNNNEQTSSVNEPNPLNNIVIEKNNSIISSVPNKQNNDLITETQNLPSNEVNNQDEELDRLLGLNKNRDSNTNDNVIYNSNNSQNIINMNDPRNENEKELDNILGLNNSKNISEENNIVENNNEKEDKKEYTAVDASKNPTIPVKKVNILSSGNKLLRNDMIVIGIIEAIFIIYTIIKNEFSFIPLIALALIGGCLFLAIKNNKYTGFLGLVIGIGMILTILTGDIINCLLGIFITIHSIYSIITNKKKLKKMNY